MIAQGWVFNPHLFPFRCLDARFRKIRVEGAFLVSAELKDGNILPFSLLSEKGRPLALQNPWPSARLKITASDDTTRYAAGERIIFATNPQTLYWFTPG